MHALELRIPPPIVTVIVAAAMGTITLAAPTADKPALLVRLALTIVIALAGVATGVSGVVAFRRARTTPNPLKPETASTLVSTGVYRLTRNPMYVGLALVLVAWGVFLYSAWASLGPVAFVLYITRFQIIPEERVLAGLFGADYAAYRAKVRRWL